MTENSWEVVASVSGELNAEILRGAFEAQGIKVVLSQEGAGRSAYSLTVGKMGKVDILVPTKSKELAQKILDNYFNNNPNNSADY